MPPSPDDLDAVRAAGSQREAAALAEARGDWRTAVGLLAEVWDHEAAIALALAHGAHDEAYRVALGALDRGVASSLVPGFAEAPLDQTTRAAELARGKGRLDDAARLLELAGETAEAAEVFVAVGAHVEAGRLLEAEGRLREAGLAYEQALLDTPESGTVALRLGRILAHFQRWDDAVALLQRAARDPRARGAAWRFLVLCFDALGLPHAAARSLDRLRSGDPTLPGTVAQYLDESFGDAAGAGRGAPVEGHPADDIPPETPPARGDDDSGALLAGRYRVLRPLGAGSTGRVVLARDVLFDRNVAVKILTVAGGSAAGRDAYTRFAREARISGGLSHPSIVAVHGYEPAGPLLVLEHLSGGTLADRLAPGQPLAPDLIRRVGRSVLEALGAVHRRGVVHRDLKPGNVFFGAAGEVKLGDFGVAHLTDLGATLTGALLGSFATMAPEQITGDTPSAATDLYAFGVVLFQMLTGRLPFDGPDFLTEHLETPPKVPSAVRSGIPADFDDLVARLLEKSTDRRLGSAAEALALFDALPWGGLPTPTADPVPAGTSTPAPPGASEGEVPDDGPRFEERGADRLWDRHLERPLRLVRLPPGPAGDALIERYLAFARADEAAVQGVVQVDASERAVLLEDFGDGDGDGGGGGGVVDEPGRRALLDALRGLHRAGVVHGEVGPERLARSRAGAAIWLLPRGLPVAGVGPADDLEAFRKL